MAIRIANITATISAANATLTGKGEFISVTNVGGGGKVYFRLDGTTAVAAADENFALPAVGGAFRTVNLPRTSGSTVVSVIASASTEVTVELEDR